VKKIRPHLTYANLASSAALLLDLTTGGAYAASKLAPKSVGERQLRPGAVTASNLRKNAVTSLKIAAGAVTLGKIAQGAVDASRLAAGAVGPFQLSSGAVITEKLASDSVTGEKVNESTLSQVPSAAKSDFATTAESANPVAFAKVSASGALDGANSKGISSVKEVEAGVYCVAIASISPHGAQVTPIFNELKPVSAFARIGGAGSACAAPRSRCRSGAKKRRPKCRSTWWLIGRYVAAGAVRFSTRSASVSMDGYSIKHRDEFEPMEGSGDSTWRLARKALGTSAFGFNLVEIDPGGQIPDGWA
jgi:hypothetical protein